jgi:hypothetical protein
MPHSITHSKLITAGGNAMLETLVALLALAPFVAGIPLLGKQLDIKHKSYDAARYSAWERSVWRSDGVRNRKHGDDISLEARDRIFGHSSAGVTSIEMLRTSGITENPLWRDRQARRLLAYADGKLPIEFTHSDGPVPVGVGYLLVPGIAHGEGPLASIEDALKLQSLALNRDAFATSGVAAESRPLLQQLSRRHRSLGSTADAADEPPNLAHVATSALLSDTWSSSDEGTLQRRIDAITTNELIEELELPGKPLGMHAPGKGRPLFGEGQFGWNPDLRPRSTALPTIYVAKER